MYVCDRELIRDRARTREPVRVSGGVGVRGEEEGQEALCMDGQKSRRSRQRRSN